MQVGELVGEFLLGHVDAAHRETFGDAVEVRRGVEPCREAVGARDLGRDPGGGALAVRARHVDRRVGELRVIEVGREREDAREIGDHARFLAGIELFQRLGVIHRGRQAGSEGVAGSEGGPGTASTVSTENVSASA